MQNFLEVLRANLLFFIEFLVIVIILFFAAYVIEKIYAKMINYKGRLLTTKKLTVIGLFSAISTILMLFEFPLPFVPEFYKIDFSEVPILIISFAYGPLAGILTEFCKIILKLLFRSSTTAFVGELANFVVGVSFILPASTIYLFKRNKNCALLGSISGTLVMTIFGSAFNAIYLLPKFAAMYGIPLDSIVAMGSALNPNIKSISTFIFFSVVPFNLIKGSLVCILTMILYKRISKILRVQNQ